jgi:Kef-type K+ transport system membrane component KefB
VSESGAHTGFLIMLAGGLIVLAILVKPLFQKLHIPALTAFLFIGFIIRCIDTSWPMLTGAGEEIFDFLAKLGVIVILFRTGLECDLRGLMRHLRGASFIWVGNMALSGIAGYCAARWILGLDLIPSLVTGTALTATSVGMTVPMWRRQKALKTSTGQQFIDVAEMDDITGVILMALLFAVLPVLRGELDGALTPMLVRETGRFVLALLLFGGFCALFSLYVEARITNAIRRIEPEPDDMLVVTGLGIMISAAAGLLGFSAAIGAFFAGLVFSRDPKRVDFDASFSAVYDLFAPFFFIGIGMTIAPAELSGAVGIGAILFVIAVLGKVIGAGACAAMTCPSLAAGLALGVSMVPRAEITMVIMKKGHELGGRVVPDSLFSGMVLVSALTCGLTPFVLRPMLEKFVAGAETEKC